MPGLPIPSGDGRLSKEQKRCVAGVLVAAACAIAYYLCIILPRAAEFRHGLQSLRPDQVQALVLRVHDDDSHQELHRELKGDDLAAFLRLIAGATSVHFPPRPVSTWSCDVDIRTTGPTSHYRFIIYWSHKNGALFDLSSNTGGDGWNYGTLRNDQFKPFIEAQFPILHRPRYQQRD